ncbi:MAG: hypothetical protein ACK48D_00615, partial [Pseudanabaena sp.]
TNFLDIFRECQRRMKMQYPTGVRFINAEIDRRYDIRSESENQLIEQELNVNGKFSTGRN